jgi:transposase
VEGTEKVCEKSQAFSIHKDKEEEVIHICGELSPFFGHIQVFYGDKYCIMETGDEAMLNRQTQMNVSEYSSLYDRVVSKTNMLRQILEMIDFGFVYDELKDKYSPSMGRTAYDPVMLFKYLLLKQIYTLSDVGVVERAFVDMSFKFFLGLSPEDDVIEPSTLTKFRRQRLKDINLLDMLIKKTVRIAIEKKIIKKHTIIVDATHTKARYNQKSPRQFFRDESRKLRKHVYAVDESFKHRTPKKPNTGILEDEIAYTKKLIAAIRQEERIICFPYIKEEVNLLEEYVGDHVHELTLSKDEDAKTGHKTADTAFFGYKTHLAMTEERIITSAVVTSGEKPDGKQLTELIAKTQSAGIPVKEVIGDAAYSEKDNIKFAQAHDIDLVSKLNPVISRSEHRDHKGFYFNKDAHMYVCPQGHLAIKKTSTRPKKHKKDGEGTVITYFFDVEKCKHCPIRDGCYKEGAKTKSHSISIRSNTHQKQLDFQNSERFKMRARQRYKIEAKNAELKHAHGFDIANSHGLFGMGIQAATSIFVVNLKRILKLQAE